MEVSAWIAALEGEFAAMENYQNREMVAELAEAESAAITLHSRLLAAKGQQVTVQTAGPRTIVGQLEAVGEEWIVIKNREGEELVVTAQIETIYPLHGAAGERGSVVKASLLSALRGLRRTRKPVSIRLVSSVFNGYIAQVRADHIDLIRQETPHVTVSIPVRHICSVRALQ